MSNKTSCRSCYYEPIYQGRYFSLNEIIAPMSIEDIEAPGFFNAWHPEAGGTPRLRQGDRLKIYQGFGSIGETLDDFTIQADAEFVVTSSAINDVRVKRVGDWLAYDADNSGAVVKWNLGRKVHQVIVDGSPVSDHEDKADAVTAADVYNKAA